MVFDKQMYIYVAIGHRYVSIDIILYIYIYIYIHNICVCVPVCIAIRYCLFVCLFGFLTSSLSTRRLTILRAATHETELGDHDFYLSWSHYTDTDTDPTSRERAATAGIEPGTPSPGVARSTD